MTDLLYALPGNEALARRIAALWPAETGALDLHRFPDGESLVRLDTPPGGRGVALVCTLHEPDAKVLPLLFAAGAARELGAVRVGLIAPYLGYMRQDRRFRDGEALTAAHFARLLSAQFDWIATVDPHLHRYPRLDAIYPIPAAAVAAAPLLAQWVREHVPAPLLVGPDEESGQWVAEVARGAGAPHLVLRKERRGDREVRLSAPDLSPWRGRRPVLVDDIVSTGGTLIEAAHLLQAAGLPPPVCLAVHAVFAGAAHENLQRAGLREVVTANTIPHPSNRLDVGPALAAAARALAAMPPTRPP